MVVLVGIVGGIGSGKSAVSDQFRQLGAEILDGDQLGHAVLREAEVIAQLTQRWGEKILLHEQGVPREPAEINRSAVAKIVFGEHAVAETELRYLEGVVHPRIRDRIRGRLAALNEEHAADEVPHVVILDAPLMIEAGWDKLCDQLVFIDCPKEVRLERVQSRGWDANELAARESRQLSIDEKRNAADWIIDNSGPISDLPAKIAPIWQSLTLPKSP